MNFTCKLAIKALEALSFIMKGAQKELKWLKLPYITQSVHVSGKDKEWEI